MFDLTSSKFIILGLIALLVVGPKELPQLLRTIGRYVGMIKKQAAEFRSQFDEAMRETELATLKQEVETLGREAENAVTEASRSVETEMGSIHAQVDQTLGEAGKIEPPRLETVGSDVAVGAALGADPAPPLAPSATAASQLEVAGASGTKTGG